MPVPIRNSSPQYKTFEVTTTSALRETVFLGTPDDYWTLDGSSIKMDVRLTPSAGSTVASFSTSGGTILILDAERRRIQFNVPHTAFSGITPGTYYYDLVVTGPDAFLYRRLTGLFRVSKGVTAP